MAKKIQNNLFDKQFGAKTGLDELKKLSDEKSIGTLDYNSLQVNQPSLVYNDIMDEENIAIVYDRHEYFADALWSDDSTELTELFTSSLQNENTKIYYRDVYKSSDAQSSPEFSIAYGDYYGYGSSTGSFGTISTNVYESKAVYSQYQNLLLNSDNKFFSFNYPSWSNKISKTTRVFSTGKNFGNNLTNYDLIDSDIFSSKFNASDYTLITSGFQYTVGLRSDGTLWSWGENSNGQLGDGTILDRNYPVQIGTDNDWKYVTAGPYHCLAIKTDGTIWAWGKGSDYRLGTDDQTQRKIPTLIQDNSTPLYIKHASAGQGHSLAVDIYGNLWGWGYNSYGQLGTGDKITVTKPLLIDNSGDWEKVFTSLSDSGDCFSIAIKTDGSLWGTGFNDNYELGLGDTSERVQFEQIDGGTWTTVSAAENRCIGIKNGILYIWGDYTDILNQIPQTPSIKLTWGINWTDIVSSNNATFAGIKNDGTSYVWGNNQSGQVGIGSNEPIISFPSPIQFNSIFDEEKRFEKKIISISTSGVLSSGGFTTILAQYDTPENQYTESDFIYVINVNRERFKDGIKPGSWELSLSAVELNKEIITAIDPITLIDESLLLDSTDVRDVYNIYSGSLSNGFYTNSISLPWGLFYPNNGIILLNGRCLYSFNSVLIDRTPATSSGVIPFSSNADVLYTSMSGSLNVDSNLYSFKGTSFERIESQVIFVRINPSDFNYTNNPSYVTGSNGIIKNELKNNYGGITYITSIGLYNENKDLVAVAKFSRPIKKTIDKDMVIKIRIRN